MLRGRVLAVPGRAWGGVLMKRLIHSSNRESWLAARDDMFCASEIARLLCEGYAKSEQERANQRSVMITEKALRSRLEPDEHMETANQLESAVLQMAGAKWWPGQLDLDGWLYQSSELSMFGATPDACIMVDGKHSAVIDLKISASRAQEDCKPKKDGSPSEASYANGCPIYYQIQLQAQMAVTGASEGWLVVLHLQYPPGMKLRRYHVQRHEGVIARIRREVQSAWSDVIAIREGRHVA